MIPSPARIRPEVSRVVKADDNWREWLTSRLSPDVTQYTCIHRRAHNGLSPFATNPMSGKFGLTL